MSTLIRYQHDMKAYRLAFSLQQRLFECSRDWPRGELQSLTSRQLRASRAIGAGLSQAAAVRQDQAEYLSRLTLVDADLAEALHWLETAHTCGYLAEATYRELRDGYTSLGGLVAAMAQEALRPAADQPARLRVVEGGAPLP